MTRGRDALGRGESTSSTAFERTLRRAERQVALIDSCVPLNAREERERLLAAWQAGRVEVPRWVLPERASLAELRRELDEVATFAARAGGLEGLYAARAEELALEAALVEARGTTEFGTLCLRRFVVTPDDATAAEALQGTWLSEIDAGDAHGRAPLRPASELVSALRRRLDELGLAARVELRSELAATAAVGEGVVYVARGAELRADQIDRIVVHEVEAHLAPRLRALRQPWGLFRVGSAGAAEDEEGRALLLEARAGYLDVVQERGRGPGGQARRRELALRHLAASAVRGGADFVELMRLLLARAEPVPRAYRLCERVLRGGGLAREVCYLPAYLRVRSAFEACPELERWFERGRVSVTVARQLEAGATLGRLS